MSITIHCDICKMGCAKTSVENTQFSVDSSEYPNLSQLKDVCFQCLEVLDDFVSQRIKEKDKLYGRE